MTLKKLDNPTSARQIAANRANALRSTGPRSAGGKAVTARNALRHGLRSHDPILPEGNAADFDRLRETLIADLEPAGGLEAALVERLAVLLWRLARVGRMESAIIAYDQARRASVEAHRRADRQAPKIWRFAQDQNWLPDASADECAPPTDPGVGWWDDRWFNTTTVRYPINHKTWNSPGVGVPSS